MMREKKRISTGTIVTVGMFTAVLGVLSILTIPMPSGVPITLQTFAMALCGYVLGAKKGISATLIYILLGTVGVPVFAGMMAGPSRLFGYTGGFIWGFLILVALCGLGIGQKKVIFRISFGMLGLVVCHSIGVVQYSMVAECQLLPAFVTVSLPYIIKDMLSVIGAYLVAMPVRKALKRNSNASSY